MFSYFSPEQRVPAKHPLRSIKAYTDSALKQIRPVLDGLYSQIGRPSIPPERLLKAQLLIALYSVRSDRLFCETLDYNILFRWFLDMGLEEPSFDASTFSKNRERLAGEEVALRFFDAVVREARALELLSDEHFSVDGTLIEAWASMKSFRPKDGGGSGPDAGGDRDFKGERRRNETHASTTDPEAKLLRKALGKEAKLCFAGHALMDNRHGLISDVCLTPSVGVTEPEAALSLRGSAAAQAPSTRRASVATRVITRDASSRRCSPSASLRMSPSTPVTTPLALAKARSNRPVIGPVRSCANASSSSLVGARRSAACARPDCGASDVISS